MKKFGKFFLAIVIILLIAVIGFGGWYLFDSLNKSNEKIKDLESKISNNTNIVESKENNNSDNIKNKEDNNSNKIENEVDNNSDNIENKADNNSNKIENKVDNNSTNTNSNNSQKLTEDEMYESVINEYKKAMSEYEENDFDLQENIEKKYSMVNFTIIMHTTHYQSEGIRMLYSFYDIDKNGVKELIVGVGYNTSNDFYEGAIYSYNQNTNKPEKVYYQDTMERGRLYIYDNGIIFSEGAGGAALHYYNFGRIAKDGSSFESIENIEEEYIQGSENPVYRDYKANKVLNYKNLNEIEDKYLSNSKVVEFNSYNEI